MAKIITWIYLGIYCATMLYLVVSAGIDAAGSISILSSIFMALLLLVPACIIAFELYGKKVPIILTLPVFLFVLVMFLGNLNFNKLAMDTILKAIVLGVMLVLLGYYTYKRLFNK